MAKDAFTENEEFCINFGLMTVELVYRGPNAEGLEILCAILKRESAGMIIVVIVNHLYDYYHVGCYCENVILSLSLFNSYR